MSETGITRVTFQPIEKAMQDAGFAVERVKQEISFALQAYNKNKQLQKCTKDSLLQAVLNVSNIGLSLNSAAKEAYLVPRWNGVTKLYEAALEPSYVGLVKLLTDAGSVTSMVCQLVYENDKFIMNLADNKQPVSAHIPELNKDKRGKVIGVYALATLHDGTRQVEYMDIDVVYEIRNRSESYKAFKEGKVSSCVWTTDEGEMIRKTVIKRIYKYLPRTDRMEAIDRAIQVDNQDYTASKDQLDYIDSLIITSTLDDRQRHFLEAETSSMSAERASEVITMLKANQVDRITAGFSYNASDIKEHQKKLK